MAEEEVAGWAERAVEIHQDMTELQREREACLEIVRGVLTGQPHSLAHALEEIETAIQARG